MHRFEGLDEGAKEGTPVNKLPSYLAMQDLAASDLEVKKLIVKERMEEANGDFGEESNWQKAPLAAPWKRLKAGWNKTDDASLAGYIDARYKLIPSGKLRDAALKVAVERARHPIRDRLKELPSWDGIERLDRLLIDYLGAEDSEYVRIITRKTLVAAVARVMEPGVKFDYMLVCTLEIWCELFGKDPGALRKIDVYEINAILRKIDGWEPKVKAFAGKEEKAARRSGLSCLCNRFF